MDIVYNWHVVQFLSFDTRNRFLPVLLWLVGVRITIAILGNKILRGWVGTWQILLFFVPIVPFDCKVLQHDPTGKWTCFIVALPGWMIAGCAMLTSFHITPLADDFSIQPDVLVCMSLCLQPSCFYLPAIVLTVREYVVHFHCLCRCLQCISNYK